eukprot:6213220-Pleurochrysis_carterae.AAC.6
MNETTLSPMSTDEHTSKRRPANVSRAKKACSLARTLASVTMLMPTPVADEAPPAVAACCPASPAF